MIDFGLSKSRRPCSARPATVLARECHPPSCARRRSRPTASRPRSTPRWPELGWTGLIVPEAHGGLGLGTLELALVLEELGARRGARPFLGTQLVAAALVRRRAPARAKKTWLAAPRRGRGARGARLSRGERPARPGRHHARREEDAGRLSPEGPRSSSSPGAGARSSCSSPRARRRGAGRAACRCSSSRAIRRASAARPVETIDLTRRVGELELRDVVVDRTALVGKEGQGWALLARLLDLGAVGIAADSLGGAERALEMAVEYSQGAGSSSAARSARSRRSSTWPRRWSRRSSRRARSCGTRPTSSTKPRRRRRVPPRWRRRGSARSTAAP
jgi:alkylation response protein AidB-like acyl-CoA dehydrogenase